MVHGGSVLRILCFAMPLLRVITGESVLLFHRGVSLTAHKQDGTFLQNVALANANVAFATASGSTLLVVNGSQLCRVTIAADRTQTSLTTLSTPFSCVSAAISPDQTRLTGGYYEVWDNGKGSGPYNVFRLYWYTPFPSLNWVESQAYFANGDLRIDSSNRFLLTPDTVLHTIYKYTFSTGDFIPLAGFGGYSGYSDGVGEAALFSSPIGLDIPQDASYAWVADYGNNRIRKVDCVTQAVTTIATVPSPQYLRFSPDMTKAWIYAMGKLYSLSVSTSSLTLLTTLTPNNVLSMSLLTLPCSVCAPGYYAVSACNTTDNTVCAICPANSQCGGGTRTACPSPSVSPAGSQSFVNCSCPQGMRGQVTSSTNAQCYPCETGVFCPGQVCTC